MENVAAQNEQPRRYVVIFYALSAIVLGFFFERVLSKVFAGLRVNDAPVFAGYAVSTLVGFGVAVAAAVVCWKVEKIRTLALQVAEELRRVTWPSFRETRAATVAVIVASAIAAVVLGIFDFVWSWLSAQIY
ncbi:MAG: preprotein translocase subunit SecE [Anaeromyxobacter sp.]